ncbi:MAG TPA: hypothetical protein QF753_01940 [Victivallales bacterium]|nr:hypothetical protein [Victivallales bacterium]
MPKARAMDPVTIAILAPILLPYAIKIAKYTAKGLIRTIPGWYKAGIELLNFFRLPLGFLQVTLGFPFGLLGYGIDNIIQGAVAPFMFFWEFLCMPLYFFGFKN